MTFSNYGRRLHFSTDMKTAIDAAANSMKINLGLRVTCFSPCARLCRSDLKSNMS